MAFGLGHQGQLDGVGAWFQIGSERAGFNRAVLVRDVFRVLNGRWHLAWLRRLSDHWRRQVNLKVAFSQLVRKLELTSLNAGGCREPRLFLIEVHIALSDCRSIERHGAFN